MNIALTSRLALALSTIGVVLAGITLAAVVGQLLAEQSLNQDKACEGFGAAVPVWKRLTPPGRPMRAAPLIALGAALTLVLRRVLRGKRWARAAA